MQPTSGHFLPVIITFSTLAFTAILVVIFRVIIRRRLEKYDDIIFENEENSYEMINYDEINENESKIEANISKNPEYLEIYE